MVRNLPATFKRDFLDKRMAISVQRHSGYRAGVPVSESTEAGRWSMRTRKTVAIALPLVVAASLAAVVVARQRRTTNWPRGSEWI